MNSKDGGPAFPRSGMAFPNGDSDYPEPGMTLRDYFAGQVLAGLLASINCFRDGDEDLLRLSQSCYRTADAMLKAREAGDE